MSIVCPAHDLEASQINCGHSGVSIVCPVHDLEASQINCGHRGINNAELAEWDHRAICGGTASFIAATGLPV